MTLNLNLGCAIPLHAGVWAGAPKAANTKAEGYGTQKFCINNQANTVRDMPTTCF